MDSQEEYFEMERVFKLREHSATIVDRIHHAFGNNTGWYHDSDKRAIFHLELGPKRFVKLIEQSGIVVG